MADRRKSNRELDIFDTPPELDLMKLVYNQLLRERFVEIDVDFISEFGFLYLNIYP